MFYFYFIFTNAVIVFSNNKLTKKNKMLKNYGTCTRVTHYVPEENVQIFYSGVMKKYEDIKLLGMYRSSFFFTIYLITYVIFLFGGAAIFSKLEIPSERALKARLDMTIEKFLNDHPTVTDNALQTLIVEIVKANNRGVSPLRNATGEPNWSFGQSLFFSSTVVTTIGYGHVTPLSKGGKIFCIIFAIIGIPMTLVLLSALVERLLVPTICILRLLNSKLGHIYHPLNIRIIHLLIIVFILIGVFLMIPAAIFALIEPEWDYLDSFYYCFISLTTIGLGDYVPGDFPNQSYRPLYKILTTVYLFSGITFMMLTLAVFYDIPQLNLSLLLTSSTPDNNQSEKINLINGINKTTMNYEGINDNNIHRQIGTVK